MLSDTTMFEIGLAWGLFCALFGYYVGQRGMFGVRIDMNNIKNDLESVKARVFDGNTVTITTPAVPVVASTRGAVVTTTTANKPLGTS